MVEFTLATMQTLTGPAAALGISGKYYLVRDVLPLLGQSSVLALLADWDHTLPLLAETADGVAGSRSRWARCVHPPSALLTPVMYPNKLLAVGANYSGHLKEMGLDSTKWSPMPVFFRPPTTSLVGPGQTVVIPRSTQQFDWECELAVVVGRRLKHASRAEAAEAIACYTIGLDLSCRDLIRVDNDLKIDLVRGKAQDTMAPCGPNLVPACFLKDVSSLRIELSVNDRL